jgi:hypothetical protein
MIEAVSRSAGHRETFFVTENLSGCAVSDRLSADSLPLDLPDWARRSRKHSVDWPVPCSRGKPAPL